MIICRGPSSVRTRAISQGTHVRFSPKGCKWDSRADIKRKSSSDCVLCVLLGSVGAVWPRSSFSQSSVLFCNISHYCHSIWRQVFTCITLSHRRVHLWNFVVVPDISVYLICLYPAFISVVGICFMARLVLVHCAEYRAGKHCDRP